MLISLTPNISGGYWRDNVWAMSWYQKLKRCCVQSVFHIVEHENLTPASCPTGPCNNVKSLMNVIQPTCLRSIRIGWTWETWHVTGVSLGESTPCSVHRPESLCTWSSCSQSKQSSSKLVIPVQCLSVWVILQHSLSTGWYLLAYTVY